MSKTDILIALVNSLTKGEKKSVRMYSNVSSGDKDYIVLYDLINGGISDKDELRREFARIKPETSFDTIVKYLYKIVLDSLVDLRKEQDSYFDLFNRLMRVKVLFEKSLYREGLNMLQTIEANATKSENYYVLLFALRLEMEGLISLDFDDMSEKQLIKKQNAMQNVIRVIRNIHEHSFLYELLRYRISRKANTIATKQGKVFEDLIFSELNIVNSLNVDVFEISKQHLLFQANYFVGIGDANQALRSFMELNELFEKHKHLWANPPVYYLNVLEGALSNLRNMNRYSDMDYFITQLSKIKGSNATFQIEVVSIEFLYKVYPMMDRGRYVEALALKWTYEDQLLKNISQLNINRQGQVIVCVSLLHYLNGNLDMAKKQLNQVVFRGKDFAATALFRAIRMINLMYLYESQEFDLIKVESRSIKREVNEYAHHDLLVDLFIRFINTTLPVTMSKRMTLWQSYAKTITLIEKNNADKKLLRVFDFISWMESKVRRTSVSEIVTSKIDAKILA